MSFTSKIAVVFALAAACATAPETREGRNDLRSDAHDALHEMTDEDPSLRALLESAPGYIIFPTVGEGAGIGGVSSGVGVAYENGEPIGVVELRGGSFGAQVGGQSYAQLVVFEDLEPLQRLKSDSFRMTADASATMVRRGAAAQARFQEGVAVFVDDETGAMLEAAVGGQHLEFEPGFSAS